VSDSGPGIPLELQKKIFDAGFSSDGRMGLGLAICREVAAEHSAELWVESAPGRGTSFNILLPIDARMRRAALRSVWIEDPVLAGQLLIELQRCLGGPLPLQPAEDVEALAKEVLKSASTLVLTGSIEGPLRRTVSIHSPPPSKG
jgi:hypothetical protein